ncbi:MAG: DMT family transporter [Planctomycetota bacterium]|nr:DMT family transporter [Planctomycetota bacterium]
MSPSSFDPTRSPQRNLHSLINNFSLKAALFAVTASLSFALMAAAVRGLSPATSGMTAVLARSLVGLIVVLILHRLLKQPFRIVNKKAMLLRVLAGSVALISFFESLRRIDLATATLLLYTCPLWVSLLAYGFLGEKLKAHNWAGLPLGLIGMAIILSPAIQDLQNTEFSMSSTKHVGLALGVLCSFSSAIAYTTLRVLGKTDNSLSIVTSFSATALLIASPVAFQSLDHWPESSDLLKLIAAGLFGASGQVFLTSAYKHGKAAQVAVITLIQVPIAVLFAYLFFNTEPAPNFLIGAVLVFLGAALQISPKKEAEDQRSS